MLKQIVTATALAAVSGTAAFAQDNETLRVGMSGGYFPFTFVKQDVLQGFEVDVMNAVGEEAGFEVEFETMAFSGLIGALDAGRIDTIANQITITPEREEKFAFTAPYVFDGAQVVTKEGNEAIGGVEDLRGRTVAVNLGSNFEQLLNELDFADEIEIKTYESNIAQDTALGRVDAFVIDRVSSAQPFSEIRNALPFQDNDEGRALRDRVDTALESLREDGTLTEISDKWFGTDITKAE